MNSTLTYKRVKEKFFGIDFIKLFSMLLVTFFLAYYAPKFFIYVLLGITLILFYRSKSNFFWLAYFIIIFSAPFGLFAEQIKGLHNGFPLFQILPGISLNYFQIFEIIAIIKVIVLKRKYAYFIKKELNALVIYFGLLVIIAFFIHKASIVSILEVIRHLLHYSLIYTLPRLITNKYDFKKFINLLLPFIILHFSDAVLFLLNGGDYFDVGFSRNQRYSRFAGSGRFLTIGQSFGYTYNVYILSMVYMVYNNRYKLLKTSFILMGFFIVLAGGFRSWFVIYIIILATYLLSTNRKVATILYGLSFIIISIGILNTNFEFNNTLTNNIERILTVTDLGEEGSIANSSIDEKTENRLPGQLLLIAKSPLTGYGFTSIKGDTDVGNFALIVDLGIIGFIIYLFIWAKYIKMLTSVIKNTLISNEHKIAAKIFLAAIIGLLISHFTTNGVFGLVSDIPLTFILLLFVSDFLMKEANRTITN